MSTCRYSRTRRWIKQRDERAEELAQILLHTTRDLTDTDARNAKVLKVYDHTAKRDITDDDRLKLEYGLTSGDKEYHNIIRIRHGMHRNRHRYTMQCSWKGTFDRTYEYLYVPWRAYYGIPGKYTLEIMTDRQFKFPPRLYSVHEGNRVLRMLMEGREPKGDDGEKGEEIPNGYRWKSARFDQNAIVAWAFR